MCLGPIQNGDAVQIVYTRFHQPKAADCRTFRGMTPSWNMPMVRITFSVCRHRASVACTAVVMAAVGSNPRSAAGSFPARQLVTPVSTAVPHFVAGPHVAQMCESIPCRHGYLVAVSAHLIWTQGDNGGVDLDGLRSAALHGARC